MTALRPPLKEVLRYLGHRGQALTEEFSALAERCIDRDVYKRQAQSQGPLLATAPPRGTAPSHAGLTGRTRKRALPAPDSSEEGGVLRF